MICPNCRSAGFRRATVHRVNALSTFVARAIGIVAFVGVLHGIVISSSGFGGHYGADPRGQLIADSLLVGFGIAAVNLGGAVLGWRLLGKKAVLQCPACGELADG